MTCPLGMCLSYVTFEKKKRVRWSVVPLYNAHTWTLVCIVYSYSRHGEWVSAEVLDAHSVCFTCLSANVCVCVRLSTRCDKIPRFPILFPIPLLRYVKKCTRHRNESKTPSFFQIPFQRQNVKHILLITCVMCPSNP